MRFLPRARSRIPLAAFAAEQRMHSGSAPLASARSAPIVSSKIDAHLPFHAPPAVERRAEWCATVRRSAWSVAAE
jgi:hypothetical protein